MTDYISREAALKTLCKYCDPEPDGSMPCDGCHPPCADYEDFKTIPAADVAPVVHGRWVKMTGMMPPEYVGHYECSECMWHGSHKDHRPETELNYCPNCGAKMDGGTQDAVD